MNRLAYYNYGLTYKNGKIFFPTGSVCGQTYQLLVAAVQCHVAEGGGDGADDPVIVHPQQLHQDGQTFLLTHRRSDVGRELDRGAALVHSIP